MENSLQRPESTRCHSDNADVYVIGDRASDVRTALNLGGTAIFIPFCY
ncbi:MAG: HAD hydrolase-like protein [Desulfobulbaceae bacterium]